MNREEVLREVKSRLGQVPKFLESLPDQVLESEWTLIKEVELKERLIPNKIKHMIGLAIASSHGHPLRSLYHVRMAKAFGASDDEIREVIVFSKLSNSWLTFISGMELGMEVDREHLKRQIMEIADFVKSHQTVGV